MDYIRRRWHIILILIALVAYLIVHVTSAITIEQQAATIHSYSRTDERFTDNVHRWIWANVNFTTDGGWYVNSPEKTWVLRKGDCSEMSLLAQQMISPYLKAEVVHGKLQDGTLHDTVLISGKWYYDHAERFGFTMIGKGLHPDEWIVS